MPPKKKKKLPQAFLSLFKSVWETAAEMGEYTSGDLPKSEAINLRTSLNIYRQQLEEEERMLYDHMMIQLIPSITTPDHVQVYVNGTGPGWSKPEHLAAINQGIRVKDQRVESPDFTAFIPKEISSEQTD